jgi:DNA-binding transcriptional MerR regulator
MRGNKMEDNKYTIPGTIVKIGGLIGAVFSEAGGFLGGKLTPLLGFGSGLLLSQITHIADNLTKETIQNWVKRNFVDPPSKGRFYDENQVARILIFNALRRAVELEDIKLLLQYARDISKGTLSEKELFELMSSAVVKTKGIAPGDVDGYEKAVGEELTRSLRHKEGDAGKIKEIVFIMLTAYQSSLIKQKADELMLKLKTSL